MIRHELHRAAPMPDRLAHPPKRPQLDAIGWRARTVAADLQAANAAAALLAALDTTHPARERADAA